MLNRRILNRPARTTLIVCAMLVTMGTTVANAALVAYVPFEEINGGITPELARGNDALINGNGVTLDNNVAAQIAGFSNFAGRFAGSDDFVELDQNGGFRGLNGAKTRSFSFWINRDDTTPDDAAVLSYGRNNGDEKFVIRRNSNAGNGTNGAIRTEINGGFEIGSTPLPVGQWTHVAMTFESDGSPNINEAKFYIDGVLETNTGNNGQILHTNASNFMQIANDRFSGGRDWDGMIDDVAVFDHALTASDVAALAAGSVTPLDFGTRTVVFEHGFEYAGGNPTFPGPDFADQLNGADGQIGTFTGFVGDGIGDEFGDDSFGFVTAQGDQMLQLDRPDASGQFEAVFDTTLRLDGARVELDVASRRTQGGSRAKDYAIIGLDENGEESFHLIVNTQNASGTVDGERLAALVNGGFEISDFLTTVGDDANEDLTNTGGTPGDNEVASIVVEMTDAGYTIFLSRHNTSFMTELLPYNGDASTLSKILFTYSGSTDDTIASGFYLDNITASGELFIIPEPTTAMLAIMGLGGMALRRRRKAA